MEQIISQNPQINRVTLASKFTPYSTLPSSSHLHPLLDIIYYSVLFSIPVFISIHVLNSYTFLLSITPQYKFPKIQVLHTHTHACRRRTHTQTHKYIYLGLVSFGLVWLVGWLVGWFLPHARLRSYPRSHLLRYCLHSLSRIICSLNPRANSLALCRVIGIS